MGILPFSRKRNMVVLLVDGPNLLRKEFDTDLGKIKKIAQEYGPLKWGAVYLNQYAPPKLVEAVNSLGLKPEVGVGEKESDHQSDVDVYIATGMARAIYDPEVGTIVLATRDADFVPMVLLAKEKNKKVVLVAYEEGLSKALKNTCDEVRILYNNKKKGNSK